MSRPIKFRKWDKDLKRMHVCGEDMRDSIIFDDNNEAYYYNEAWYYNLDKDKAYELMQYTGLKDRNEKEIYEGDILKWYDRPLSWYRDPDKTSCSQTIDVAVFSDGSFRTRKYSELLINLCGTKHFNFLERSEIEVIGNIYENPSLLEDTP